jgi:hypothetical protein
MSGEAPLLRVVLSSKQVQCPVFDCRCPGVLVTRLRSFDRVEIE